jgi:hypothetical protein
VTLRFWFMLPVAMLIATTFMLIAGLSLGEVML